MKSKTHNNENYKSEEVESSAFLEVEIQADRSPKDTSPAHASWLRQVEACLKDMVITDLASAWATARRRQKV